ncbi:MAG: class I SAM-dependent methyltransferase [Ilumatobacter sp.]|uniref:class I SAM-dependent methyltransferase n=1 Tax=Ilumatobacter sp. TaxID=1967498 RepID=UPI003C75A7FD
MTTRHDLDIAASPTTDPRARPSTFDNGRIGRLNAWFFDAFDRYINLISRRHKRHAFADIGAGTVLEIGAGVGANFDYLLPGTHLIAVEPNEAMHPRLIERARDRDLDIDLVGARAEHIPVPDDSVDTVICSLVLCTVSDPTRALAEICRVLRPGGTFRFVEHVAAHPVSPRRWIQTAIARPWSWLFEGCQLCRDTGALIEASDLDANDIRTGRFDVSAFIPVNTVISGWASKPCTDTPATTSTAPRS